jgi:hypothetical protein
MAVILYADATAVALQLPQPQPIGEQTLVTRCRQKSCGLSGDHA